MTNFPWQTQQAQSNAQTMAPYQQQYGNNANATYAHNFDQFFGQGTGAAAVAPSLDPVARAAGMSDYNQYVAGNRALAAGGQAPSFVTGAGQTGAGNTSTLPLGAGGTVMGGGMGGGSLPLGAGGANFGSPWQTMGVRSPWEGGGGGPGAMGGMMGSATGVGGPGLGAGGASFGGMGSANGGSNAIRAAMGGLNFGGDNIGQSARQAQQLMQQNGWSAQQVADAMGYGVGDINAVLAKAGPSGAGQANPQNSFTSNPFYGSMANDITRRTQQALGQSLNGIRGNAVGVGGLGGSRQGVAEGHAISGAMDNLSGQLGAMGSGMWNADQNRDLSRYQGDQSFYTAQRGQDYQGIGLGADLMSRGLQTQWTPLQNANNIYGNYSGMGQTTNSSQQGGGWGGAIGGALGAAQFGQNMGWWK
jgi:hypothetical protein